MARMHSRKKGKAGSARPNRTSSPDWADYEKKEVEDIIVKLGKEGQTTSKIGVTLRDQYGVPSAKLAAGKKIDRILEDNNIKKELPEDLMQLMTRAVIIDRHMSSNHNDMASKRGMQLTESKIRRLVKYYKRNKRIPADWSYSLKTAKLLVK